MENTENRTYTASGGRGHSIASLTLGILGLLFLFTGMPFISLILGIIGAILASGARRSGCSGSMTTAGAVLSWISIVIGVIMTILFFMMIAGLFMFSGFWLSGIVHSVHNATTAATI